MKKQVILTVGAPGAGKSTWAESQAKDPKTLIVCRDNLREMFFGGTYKYSRVKEKAVTDHVKSVIKQFLHDDHFATLILADTNLNDSTRKTYLDLCILEQKDSKHEVEFIETPFDVSWIELEKRNLKRGHKAVPKDVLRSMYLNMQKYLGKHKQYEPKPELAKAVIFDLDGTLADNNHRGAFEYDKIPGDKPNEFVVNMLKHYHANGYKIICVSGRNAGHENDPIAWQNLTATWLNTNGIPADRLLMRQWNDFRSDDIIKEEIFWEHIAPYYNVECAFDDRDRVVEMWRRIGVNCAQVNFGEF